MGEISITSGLGGNRIGGGGGGGGASINPQGIPNDDDVKVSLCFFLSESQLKG